MRQITLTNDFHGSSVAVRLSDNNHLSAAQVRKARRALCGYADCMCGGTAGTRGRQRTEDGERIDLIPTADGGMDVEIGG